MNKQNIQQNSTNKRMNTHTHVEITRAKAQNGLGKQSFFLSKQQTRTPNVSLFID